jgi:hypothetical protein
MYTNPEQKQFAPATQRNREPILKILQQVLPKTGTILEIASGTGEHAVFFASHLAPRKWLPSDSNPIARDSITAWIAEYESDNIYLPLDIDAHLPAWQVEKQTFTDSPIVAIVNINMIHISPWSACLGLMAGSGRILPPDGILYLYGPYKQKGQHTASSNAAFDESLRSQNPDWGVRNLEDVIEVAKAENLILQKIYPMPANNLSLVFKLS